MVKYAIVGVEGNHDQAFVGRVLKYLGWKQFDGQEKKLDPFWRKFIPRYPRKGNLYKRLDMPSIWFDDRLSVAVYVGEGSNLNQNLDDILQNNPEYKHQVDAFGIVADSDRTNAVEVARHYADSLKAHFPNFPDRPGIVDRNSPRTGMYILPDNSSTGVLDTLLCRCGAVIYPEYMSRAHSYLDQFSDRERRELKWKPFDNEKALIATVASILKPGKTNTASISDNCWICQDTVEQVAELQNFVEFFRQLLAISESESEV